MTYIRKLILALALSAGLAPAFAQVPPPVPALPDTERRTTYSISASTCACAVNFALYGDSTDYANWIEVFVNGVRMAQAGNWTLSSVTGTIGSIPLPITNAVLTFTAPQTGTIQIVGARRPRRTSQFNEGAGVPTRNFNVVLSDLTAQNRELWDKTNDVTGRALISQPGNTISMLPLPSVCAGKFLGFDATGLIPQCSSGGAGSGNVVGPGSSVNGNFALFNGTTGALLKDGGTPAASATTDTTNASNISSGTLAIARLPADATTWRTASVADTVLTTDCGKTIGLGGNALFSETLPVVAGFPAGCEVTVKNTDTYTGPGTGRAKQIIGFPTDIMPPGLSQGMLYPQEVVRVKIINGAWVATLQTGRWTLPQTVTLCVDTSGNDATGDGLVALATAGATCLRNINTAGSIIQKRFDTNQTTPIIAPTISQTFTDQLSLGGQPTGSNLIQLSPNGNGTFNWTNAASCISVGDNAELDLRLNGINAGGNINFTCNSANTAGIGAIYLHNYTVLDLEGGPPTFNLGGANDSAIFCDGKGIGTIANGITVAGTGNYAATLDQDCKFSWSGSPTIGRSGAPTLAGLWKLNGGSSLVLGAAATVSGYTSLGPSLLSGNSTFLRSGAAAGVFTITSGSQLCDTMNPCNFAWTPTDASGAALTFTGVSAAYNIVGNMIFASALVTYPATGNGSAAVIGGFPFNFSASNYGRAGCTGYSNTGGVDKLLPNGATATAGLINNANATITNVTLTGATVIFNCTYPMQ